MKPYILTTVDKHKMLISGDERNAILAAVNSGEKAIVIQDCLISLAIVPEVMPFIRWFEQENDRLKNSQKRICKKCLGVMDIEVGCVCWDRNTSATKNPFILPESIRRQLGISSASMQSFPELTAFEIEWDAAAAEYQAKRQVEYIGGNRALGYIDPATGEAMFS